jgi:hypothetical protein
MLSEREGGGRMVDIADPDHAATARSDKATEADRLA